jgi:two-component system response regulator YesN
MSLFSNIIAPLIAGLFFLLYFVYFSIANPSKAKSYKYFVIFLIGISLFALGRPLQLILGPHPMPLIIVNIRMIILCGLISPVIILASDLFNRKRSRKLQTLIIAFCALLGLTYVVFNTLGTHESRVLFHFAGISAQDNLTPSMQGPFYGREVTIIVQVVTGLLLALFSLIKLIKLKIETPLKDLLKNKIFLFNSGVFIFAFSFIVGSLAKQWGIYYVVSMISALLFGGSVLMDIKEVYHYYEKLIPFIKEDIIHNVALSGFSNTKLVEMLDCLGKNSDLNTFVVVKIKDGKTKVLQDLQMIDEVLRSTDQILRNYFAEECYILLPLSNYRIGVALKLKDTAPPENRVPFMEILEEIQREISSAQKCSLAVGIGRTYEGIENLRTSYHEALNAQEYAERLKKSNIIHVDNINELDHQTNTYPVKEKEKLLSLIKVGDTINSRKAFAEYIERFKSFIAEKPDALKVRLYEFIGSIIDSAILGGGDEKKLNERMEEFFSDINHITDMETVENWMSSVVVEITETVAHIYESRSKTLIKKALRFIEENYNSQLSYKDVANEVFISPSYFLSLFKQETGYTFVDYLTVLRIEKAKEMLLTSDMTITQIADNTGFNNSNYFSRIFKKITGIRARDYRIRSDQPLVKTE